MSKKPESETTPQVTTGSTPTAATTTGSQAPSAPELASLMQVREILTGPLASNVDQRIAEMDQRLDQTLQGFTQTTMKRVETVEQSYKDELSQLRTGVEEDRTQFHDRLERLERELSLGLEQMRGEIKDVSDQMATDTEALRVEFGKDFDAIRGTIQELFEKVTVKLDEEKHRMRDEMVDRDTLSAALSEVAMRLAPPSGDTLEMDPNQPDIELDHILDQATSGGS